MARNIRLSDNGVLEELAIKDHVMQIQATLNVNHCCYKQDAANKRGTEKQELITVVRHEIRDATRSI